jgi:hypothetical protein
MSTVRRTCAPEGNPGDMKNLNLRQLEALLMMIVLDRIFSLDKLLVGK